ncbi:hypothetical protein [Cohnella mopanensis]|uniref:hypothetical protein n=1 Tax=Cohnella mopanensis TaxID=2911966 RepID=UPI001EF8CD9B|nr:hypothetical protein [Cohnella mopanensis]
MSKIKSNTLFLMVLFILLIVGWFLWMSKNAALDTLIDIKSKDSIINAIEMTQWEVERTQMNIPKSMPFYAARLDLHQDLIVQKVLYLLNSDSTIPPVKLIQFSLHRGMSMDIHATFEFSGALGIKRKININANQQWIAFKNETGTEIYNKTKKKS